MESMDYEDQVVKKMEESKPKDMNLMYRVGDVTNLTKLYKDEQFDCAVDKGTLDAIAVDFEEKTVKMCEAYFNEVMHVLNNKNGTLMIVSLLQPHVLKIILDFFIKGENNVHIAKTLFEVKIQRIVQIDGYAEKQFIKYFISIKKNQIDSANPKMVDMQDSIGLKDSPDHQEQFLNFDQTIEKIKVDQQIYMIAPTLKNLDGERDIAMHCYDYSSGN